MACARSFQLVRPGSTAKNQTTKRLSIVADPIGTSRGQHREHDCRRGACESRVHGDDGHFAPGTSRGRHPSHAEPSSAPLGSSGQPQPRQPCFTLLATLFMRRASLNDYLPLSAGAMRRFFFTPPVHPGPGVRASARPRTRWATWIVGGRNADISAAFSWVFGSIASSWFCLLAAGRTCGRLSLPPHLCTLAYALHGIAVCG